MSVIEKLLVVQEHDCRIRDMEKELRDIPERKKAEQSRLDQRKKALSEAGQALKARQMDIKNLEGEGAAFREKIVKLRQQQMELKTNKEFRAMDEEIKGVQKQITDLEDRELVSMEELEKTRADEQTKKNAVAEEDAVIQVDIKALDERAAAIEARLKGEKDIRGAAAKDVPKDWLSVYERIFHRKDKAIVPLEDGICGGCHMKLPPAIVHESRKRASMITCSYCGRMLF